MLFCLLDVHPCFLYPCPPYVSIFLFPNPKFFTVRC
jgi:hypothetical protein